MPRQSIFDMKFTDVYPLLVQKAERKGRTRDEVDAAIRWLTGYDMAQVDPDADYVEEEETQESAPDEEEYYYDEEDDELL